MSWVQIVLLTPALPYHPPKKVCILIPFDEQTAAFCSLAPFLVSNASLLRWNDVLSSCLYLEYLKLFAQPFLKNQISRLLPVVLQSGAIISLALRNKIAFIRNENSGGEDNFFSLVMLPSSIQTGKLGVAFPKEMWWGSHQKVPSGQAGKGFRAARSILKVHSAEQCCALQLYSLLAPGQLSLHTGPQLPSTSNLNS